MQQIDLAFLMSVGSRMRSLMYLDPEMDSIRQYILLNASQTAIHEIVYASVYAAHFHHPLRNHATRMMNEIQGHIETTLPTDGGSSVSMAPWHIQQLKEAFSIFEAVLESEIQSIGSYIITQKSGFVTASMVDNGSVFFPEELGAKVPEAIADLEQAMRCIALEAPTAAGFHLHRANEAVLRSYWDNVTSGQPRPKQGNMGVYLKKLRELGLGRVDEFGCIENSLFPR